jgi:hypothetical protein
MKHTTRPRRLRSLILLVACLQASSTSAQTQSPADIEAMSSLPRSEMETVVRGFDADRGALLRRFDGTNSPRREARMLAYYQSVLANLDSLPFDSMSIGGKADWVLTRNLVRRELHQIETARKGREQALIFAPFAQTIWELTQTRQDMTRPGARAAATTLAELKLQIDAATKKLDEQLAARKEPATASEKSAARRASLLLADLRGQLTEWYRFYEGYDPLFTWWNADPFKAADSAFDGYMKMIRERIMGITVENPHVIIGVPIGRDALEAELKYEMIPYSPEELLAIGEREFAWCEAEMKKAAAEMGFPDDWHKAMEQVKQAHVEPGDQPAMIRDLAFDAIAFLKANDLITVPPMAVETWRMEMMSPERQLVAPFFLGGESIIVSYPVSSMSHEHKLMSMRGNNRHFSHATVFHELIPGHHLQQFMNSRTMVHRAAFDTPFWIEGWALYWEMLMWDKGYHATPQDRIGALFWRSHRCARIIFSIKFHMGEMTPQQCVDLLVDRVGHERANAEGEVRRSLLGDYGPLYQLAYMTGGLQIRAMRKELVESGKMTDRQFHDAIMRENAMPIEMLRCIISKTPPSKDFETSWRFDSVLHPTP